MKTVKKYLIFIIALLIIGLTFLWSKEIGTKSVKTILTSGKEMIFILPPIFVLLGLLDVWVPRETMVKFMGEGSGLHGILLAFLLGSAAAGPLYVVLPIAIAFMKKDVKFSNILILVGAWSTTKIPMVMFELTALGTRFAFTRLLLNIPIILLTTVIMSRAFKKDEIEKMYEVAKTTL